MFLAMQKETNVDLIMINLVFIVYVFYDMILKCSLWIRLQVVYGLKDTGGHDCHDKQGGHAYDLSDHAQSTIPVLKANFHWCVSA